MMKTVVCAVLAIMVVISALQVVVARHESRRLFVELQGLEHERDAMNVEWGQLQLEQATWATHARVEDIARQKLGMTQPTPQTTVMLTP